MGVSRESSEIPLVSHDAHLTFEELMTALVEIEAVMNSRPLSATSTDPSDFEALTPGHFLIGCPLRALSDKVRETSLTEISHLQRWQRIGAVKSHFWSRWRSEYLTQLQQRYKWQTPQRSLATNDMVLVHEDGVPPMKWTVGRVTNVFYGADGMARVAEVRTPSTTLKRPIAKLAVLPTN